MDGYVKLHRKLLENPIVCKDADYLSVWVYLLLDATHTNRSALFKGDRITLIPGQLITGRKIISKKLCIDENKVQRILKKFETEQQIKQQTGNKNRLITIVNWDKYQIGEQQIAQQMNNNCTTDEQQVNTNKKEKKDKNVKKKDNCAPEVTEKGIVEFFESLWILYPLKRGKAAVSLSQKKRLYVVGYEPMLKAIERYKEDLKRDASWRKPQNGSTFFNSGYVDYLDENYTAPPSVPVAEADKPRKTGFQNFEQRDTDYDAMVMERLRQKLGGQADGDKG